MVFNANFLKVTSLNLCEAEGGNHIDSMVETKPSHLEKGAGSAHKPSIHCLKVTPL